ncbi:MAG TPA: hypothetical protein VFP80_14965 [Thermoanaerobaculia bacterium]|nr:hypothetical protein [Thermoanaerobaculia bacterium]
MATRLDLPEDLLEEIQHLASQEGRKLDETVTDLLRKALGGSSSGLSADAATIETRRELAEKFISGEWGVQLSGFEAARAADRDRASRYDDKWRD